MTDEDRLWYAIQDIVRKYTQQIWLTPYNAKQIIPNENIYPMKQELFNLVKSLQKGTNSGKMQTKEEPTMNKYLLVISNGVFNVFYLFSEEEKEKVITFVKHQKDIETYEVFAVLKEGLVNLLGANSSETAIVKRPYNFSDLKKLFK